MKRLHVLVLAAAVCAMLAFPGTAFAEHLTGKDGWTVTYTAGGADGQLFQRGLRR